jgi:hypothetical protein
LQSWIGDMAELVDAPDLKSVGQYARAGSIPAIPTIFTNIQSLIVRAFLRAFFIPEILKNRIIKNLTAEKYANFGFKQNYY